MSAFNRSLRKIFLNLSSVSLVACNITKRLQPTHCEKSSDKYSESLENPPHDYVVMSLFEPSKEILQEYLANKNIRNEGNNQVHIRKIIVDEDDFVYEPLYGERAAFRLKGIVTTKDGSIAVRNSHDQNLKN